MFLFREREIMLFLLVQFGVMKPNDHCFGVMHVLIHAYSIKREINKLNMGK